MSMLTVKDLIKIALGSYETYLDATYVTPDPALAALAKENFQQTEQLLEERTRETPKS